MRKIEIIEKYVRKLIRQTSAAIVLFESLGLGDLIIAAKTIDLTRVHLQIDEDVNIRKRPHAGAKVIDTILEGETVDLLDCSGDLGWYFVRCPDNQLTGWVDSRYVEAIPLLIIED